MKDKSDFNIYFIIIIVVKWLSCHVVCHSDDGVDHKTAK